MSWQKSDGSNVSVAGNIDDNDKVLFSRDNSGKILQTNLFDLAEALGFVTSASVAEFVTSSEADFLYLTKTSANNFVTSGSVSAMIAGFGFAADALTSASADAKYLEKVSALTTANVCTIINSYSFPTSSLTIPQVQQIVEAYGYVSAGDIGTYLTTAQGDDRYVTTAELDTLFLTTSEADTRYITSNVLSAYGFITSASTSSLVSSIIIQKALLTSASAESRFETKSSAGAYMTSALVSAILTAREYLSSASVSSMARNIASSLPLQISRDLNPTLGNYLKVKNFGYTVTAQPVLGQTAFKKGQIGRIGTEGKLFYTNAASENLSQGILLMALADHESGVWSSATMLNQGFIETTGLTPGAIYYLDSSAGGMTTTKPTLENYVIRRVGQARTSTDFYFDPSNDYTLIGASAIVANVPDVITDLQSIATGDGFVTLDWNAPNDNSSAILQYIIEYQANGAGVSVWTCVTASSDETIYSVSTLVNSTTYNFRAYAQNGVGNAGISNVVSATPSVPNSTSLVSVITTGIVAWWDPKTYVSTSANLRNSVSAPADGVSSDKYVVSPTDVSTFSVNKFVMNNLAYFTSTSNTAFINSLHKTDGTANWTWFAAVETNGTGPTLDTLFSTASASTEYGINIRSDGGGALKIDFFLNPNRFTVCAPGYVISAGVRYNMAISRQSSAGAKTGTLSFLVAPYSTSATTVSATWNDATITTLTSNISASASRNFTLAAQESGGSPMDTSTVFFAQALFNRKLSDSEINSLFTWADSYYTQVVVEPEAPSMVIANPGVSEVFLASYSYDTGGAPITNYRWEYKAETTADWTSANNSEANITYTISGLNIGTAYHFRCRARNNVGFSPYSATVTATPTSADGITSAPYVMTPYKCTFPVNTSANGPLAGSDAWEVGQPELLSINNVWHTRGNGTITFSCPDGGATTTNASYARTEYRHLTDIPHTTPTEDTVDFAVIQIPNGHKTVLHQIHGLGAPPYFKLNYTGKDDGTGTLRALCKVSTNATVDTTTTLLTGISNGQRIISRVQYTGTALLFHVNGTLVLNQPMDITIGDYYWKRGNYYQTNAKLGNVCKVVHYPNPNNYI